MKFPRDVRELWPRLGEQQRREAIRRALRRRGVPDHDRISGMAAVAIERGDLHYPDWSEWFVDHVTYEVRDLLPADHVAEWERRPLPKPDTSTWSDYLWELGKRDWLSEGRP